MKFLIVEDDYDLRELLIVLILGNYNIEIHEAFDGQDAIEKFQSHGPFDLIMCDYHMPRKNGAEVFVELRKQNKVTPFILISSDADKFKALFPDDQYTDTLDKPYLETDLTKKIEKLLLQKKLLSQKELLFQKELLSQKELLFQKESHLPIAIDILEKIVYPGVSLFIRLSQEQHIKVLKEDAQFDRREALRFKNKNLAHLYVELIDIKTFMSNFRKNVFAKIDWDNIDTTEAMNGLQADWSLILNCSRNLGWSDSVTSLAQENIAKTLVLLKKTPKLKSTLESLSLSKNSSQVAPHCYFLIMLATAILQELKWDSPSTLKMVTFAALLHDMELSDFVFVSKLDRLTEKVFDFDLGDQTNLKIFTHPIAAAKFASSWTSCPADVDKLILQHHERFDGKGFPNKMNFLTIFPLAGVMIMAEDIIYQTVINKELNPVEYMKSCESYYSRGDFKKIYSAVLKVLESSYRI